MVSDLYDWCPYKKKTFEQRLTYKENTSMDMKTAEAKEHQRFQQTTRAQKTVMEQSLSLTALSSNQPANTLNFNF